MANPQKENGYVAIANEVADILMKTQINGYQSRLLWAIWRKTYGWNKAEDWISNSQLCLMTGLHKAHICRAIKQLIDRKIVTKNGNKIKFSKDYSQWKELPKLVTGKKVTKFGNSVAKSGNKKLPNLADTKDTIQNTLYKTNPLPPKFEDILKLYPNKKNLFVARQNWDKLSAQEKKMAIEELPKHCEQEYWQKDNGAYIPTLATWLRNKRWNDILASEKIGDQRNADDDFNSLTQN